ncbi:hypothetical protein WN71_021465 [Streptomyces mangrovisoli]|uniref:Serine/threonine protein kinase n=1 Tax=Streptomyces mangrovisoli TaxID=1428628 RepID=A0A1J4NXF9_9ACTN|nr:hypothetical protein WN71_021465 [Streptomyces mangrovisoli]
MRIAAAAAGLAGVFALTACSGGGSDDGSSATPSTSATSATATGGGSDGSGGTASSTKASGLQGSWLATTDGKAVALVVTGTKAGLFATGGTVCSGTAGEEAGMRMIHLTCSGDAAKDRTTGMVDSLGKSSMTVTWSGGKIGKETYTKAQGGKLPAGLATATTGS